MDVIRKVLIADEDKDIRFLIRMYLRGYDLEFLEAANGQECLDLAKEVKPDLIILNYMLDKLTGYQVALKLYKLEETGNIPVIMMTLEGFDLVEEETGIYDYLGKPFTREHCIKIVERVMGNNMFPKSKENPQNVRNSASNNDNRVAATSDPGKRKRILVADDEPDIIKLLKLILEKEYDVDCVESGEELVQLAKINKYDLIVSDVIMPKLSGWKSIQQLRDAGIDVPVIFNSGLVKDKNLYETLKPNGISYFMLKPFNRSDLLAKVKEFIN